MLRTPTCFVLAAWLAAGCAEHMSLLQPGHGGPSPFVFWPPPPPTSVWTATTDRATFGDVAKQVMRGLEGAGYAGARWYPVGVDFAHGFALATRLERIESDGSPARDRWCSLYGEASNLRWLEGARDPRLPSAGRFRVFLVAFTDLPVGRSEGAPRWNEDTLMDAPDLPAMRFPAERRVTSRFRVSAFVYEYAASSPDGQGDFIATDDRLPASTHVRGARLTALAGTE
jgi:hypothetical protein